MAIDKVMLTAQKIDIPKQHAQAIIGTGQGDAGRHRHDHGTTPHPRRWPLTLAWCDVAAPSDKPAQDPHMGARHRVAQIETEKGVHGGRHQSPQAPEGE